MLKNAELDLHLIGLSGETDYRTQENAGFRQSY
jgi:hypothetical protein